MSAKHFLIQLGIDFTNPQFKGQDLAADWIRDLERSDSRLHKEKVIEKALMAAKLGSASAQGFLFNCYLAYNPFYTYNVKQVPETQGLVDKDNPWPQFWAVCEALRTRSATGHQARRMIEQVSQNFDSEQWNTVCRRVLIKDLRCGISEKTLNKVIGRTEWAIPVFGCQLATDSTEHAAKLTGRCQLETKLDGVRVIAIISANGIVTMLSRNGKVFENFGHIEKVLAENANTILGTMNCPDGIMLDGEVIGQSFQDLMKQARRKRDADASDSRYYVFDYTPLQAFQIGEFKPAQLERTIKLGLLAPILSESPVRIMPFIHVDLSTSEGHDIMRRFANDAVAEGFEGIMIKKLDAPYQCKRTTNWMKWKPTITVDLTIVDFEEGTGRNQGRLGAIICEGEDDGRRIRVNVGSGFSDSDRDSYWTGRDRMVKQIVEVRADAVTQNQDGTYSLRFPRFLRFRGFRAGEKI